MIYSDLLSQLNAKRSSHDIFPFFLGGGDEHDLTGIILSTHKSQGKGHIAENPTRVEVRTTPLALLGAKR